MADERTRVAGLPADKLRRLMARLTGRQEEAAIPRAPREGGPLPLSFAQERLWFLDNLEGGGAYHIPAAVRLHGPLDVLALERSFGAVVGRHEALRTTFSELEGRGLQTVHEDLQPAFPRVDLSVLPAPCGARELAHLMREEARRPFDLARGPLLRIALFRLGAEDHLLALTLHHIVADGWSLGVLVREVAALYEGLVGGEAAVLPELPIQYGDYALWQRERQQGEVLEAGLAFWRQRLAGLPPLELAADRPRPAAASFRGGLVETALTAEELHGLAGLAQREGATPFMVLLALLDTLLLRYTGQTDFGVGTPVANRTRREVEGLIGLFVNTVVLRADLTGRPGFTELLRRTRETTLAAFSHEELPFDKVVEELRPERGPGRSPLFQVLLTLQNQPWPALRIGALDLELAEVDTGTARADLTLMWRERQGGLAGVLEYSTDLFEPGSAERLLGHMTVLLHGVLADPGTSVWDLPLLSAAERRQLLGEQGGVSVPYPREATVHALFEEQAAKGGDRIAVEAGDEKLTYAELEARANRLAHRLRRLGVGPESLVGLAVPRSPAMIVGLLGILKAGGAYLPLDPSSPRERLSALVDEARPRALVTLEPLLPQLPAGIPSVRLDLDHADLEVEPAARVEGGAAADNLVYVLYTSGSTGRPKGVAVPHRGVVRLVTTADYVRLDEDQVLLQLAPLAFDASTLEIWGALANGARVALAPPEPPSLAELGRLLASHRVTTLWLTAGLFHQMVDEGLADLSGLSQLLAGGDVLSPPHVRRALAALPGCALVNGYGPTENTTFTCCHRLAGAPEARVPIGRPIANTRVYLLDREGRPVPVGVPGELYTGGDGLARGYLGRPDLTAERFVPSPLAGAEDPPGGRLYRTGDLARFRPDGSVDFLGRIDQQVKIRGFRIEPGEIEAVLAAHPAVAKCAVVVRGGAGDRSLVAWYALRQEETATPAELRAWLAARLPAYMVPAVFAPLAELPLTSNGKVDRRDLTRRELPRADRLEWGEDDEPRTALERQLATIWQELLGCGRIGIRDDFFALGGHSLLATRVISRLRASLGIDLPLASLFEHPTVAGLAAAVERVQGAHEEPDADPIPRTALTGGAPLSFAQQRLWFLDRFEPGSWYNVPVALRLEGDLDVQALAASLGEIVRRHEALRTAFPERAGRPVQEVGPASAFPLPFVDLTVLAGNRREAALAERLAGEAAQRFDLAQGPVLRTVLLRTGEREHVLALTVHHIAADGWSVGVFVRELGAIYAAYAAGRPSPLPEPPLQYKDFAVWHNERLTGALLDRQLAAWRERLAGVPAVLELPLDRPRPPVQTFRGATLPFHLGRAASAGLRDLAGRAGATLFMALLAGFAEVLHRYSGQQDLLIGSPVAGRTRRELEGLIGVFINTVVLRADLAGDPAFSALLARAREAALFAYTFQELPFERLLEELQPARDLSRPPLFQVMLVLQNSPLSALELPGLAISPLPVANGTAKLELSLSLSEVDGEITGEAEYNADLFDRATISRLLAHLETLLTGAVADPDRRLSALPLLSAGEKGQLLEAWNDTASEIPDVPVHQLFRYQAECAPEAIALVFGDEVLTYRELALRSGRLARHLRRMGVGPEVLVGIAMERSVELLVAVLGVLTAGGAYVPLDPAYPVDRLHYMVRDSGVRVLLSQSRLAGILPVEGLACLNLDAGWGQGAGDGEDVPDLGDPDNLAYVIYTSGSTGRPKGVAVPHRALANTLWWMLRGFDFRPDAVFLAVTSLSFDIAVSELILPLLVGARLEIVPGAVAADGFRLRERLRSSGATYLQATPATWRMLLEAGLEEPTGVRLAVTGGEALAGDLAAALCRRVGELWNLYGPTETTVWSTALQVAICKEGVIPIGRPIANTRIYVLDRFLELVPIGVPGEVAIGGTGVTRGYLGRPDLTAERFVPDPWSPEPGARIYRTGDLARWRSDGVLDFLGRLDHQIKIRGFRIEIGEIEAALVAHPAIREAVVVAREDGGDRRLVAYVVHDLPGGPDGAAQDAALFADLREALRRSLPEPMVPTYFMVLEALPLTPNRKVDRKALPRPERPASGIAYEPPGGGLEQTLAALWQELLGLERVGRNDNFFELGGHSLLMAQVQSKLRQTLGREIGMVDLFSHPTISSLSRFLAADNDKVEPSAVERQTEERADRGKSRLQQLRQKAQTASAVLDRGLP